MNFLSLPQIQPRTGAYETEGFGNALSEFGQVRRGLEQQSYNRTQAADEKTYQRGRDAKQDGEREKQMWGKRALAFDQMPDGPNKPMMWKRIIAGQTGLTPEEMDYRTGPKLMAAQAGLYNDPRDSQMKDLDIEQKRAQINAANQRSDPTKVVEVNGRLVRVGPQGAEEIYNGGAAPASRTKGAPSGYLWKDPNNPAAGVESIPGFDKPIPGDIAGKVAMMNMAQKRIEATRSVFERDWSAGDTAQYGAANVPIVGDLGFASGNIGIAQRDIRTGIEAALRTMTGAAAPEQEVARYMQMFMPNIKDTKQTAKQKIDGLMKFMTDANELVLRGRGDTQGINQPQAAPEVTAPSQALARPQSKQEYDSMRPGTRYLDPTGTPRTKQ